MKTFKDDGFYVKDGMIYFQQEKVEQSQMLNEHEQGNCQGNCEGDGDSLEFEDQNFQGSEPQSSSISTQPSELNLTTHGRTVPLTARLSNIDFKKTYRPFRKYRRISKLPKNPYEKTHYGNKSYFFLTIQYFQKIGCNLKKLFQFYVKEAKALQQCEQGKNKLSESVKEYYSIAIRAFAQYINGDIAQAFKTFYKYENMRLKHNLNNAYEYFISQGKRAY